MCSSCLFSSQCILNPAVHQKKQMADPAHCNHNKPLQNFKFEAMIAK